MKIGQKEIQRMMKDNEWEQTWQYISDKNKVETLLGVASFAMSS